jgi:hypothetical protein
LTNVGLFRYYLNPLNVLLIKAIISLQENLFVFNWLAERLIKLFFGRTGRYEPVNLIVKNVEDMTIAQGISFRKDIECTESNYYTPLLSWYWP